MGKETSFVFTGDIGFDKYMDHKWEDEDLISKDVLSFLHSGDHVVINVEGALMAKEEKKDVSGVAQLVHSMDPSATSVFDLMHADIWNLCNNHIMDCGEEGVKQTLGIAKQHHAKTVGVGLNEEEALRPLYFEEAGGIGMFSVGYPKGCKPAGENKSGTILWNKMDLIQKNIDVIKSKCRWCILIVHGCEEFNALPMPYIRDRYLKFLDMGVDIIVGHHPHVPMNYEIVNEKIIFYSLGNFIFDTDYQRAQFHTDKGILLKLNLNEQSYSWAALGIQIDRTNEHIVKADLPLIFENVPAKEYELLLPLAAKMFVVNTKRQQIYLNPKEFKDADERKWKEHFANPNRPGRIPGELLDFFAIIPLAEKEAEKTWEKSTLENVKKYILEQM